MHNFMMAFSVSVIGNATFSSGKIPDGFKTYFFFVCCFGYIHGLKKISEPTLKIYYPLKKQQQSRYKWKAQVLN